MSNQNWRSLHLNCWLEFLLLLADYMLILYKHCFHFLLELTIPPGEIEDNACAKFRGNNKECYGIFEKGLWCSQFTGPWYSQEFCLLSFPKLWIRMHVNRTRFDKNWKKPFSKVTSCVWNGKRIYKQRSIGASSEIKYI